MNEKYMLTDETKLVQGQTLHRIRALQSFGGVKAGDLGGWIRDERNLSTKGTAWVSGEACVYDSAIVTESALVRENATVRGTAIIRGNGIIADHALIESKAKVFENALVMGEAIIGNSVQIFGNACVGGSAHVNGGARIYGNSDISGEATIVSGMASISGDVCIRNATINGTAFVCGAPTLSGGDISISKPNDYLTIGSYGQLESWLTFARTFDCRIRLISSSYTGDIEDWRPEGAKQVKDYYRNAIKLAKTYISDTIYTAIRVKEVCE